MTVSTENIAAVAAVASGGSPLGRYCAACSGRGLPLAAEEGRTGGFVLAARRWVGAWVVPTFLRLPACTAVPSVALLCCLAPESALYTRAGPAACLRDAYGARESVAGSWKRRIEAWRTGSLAL